MECGEGAAALQAVANGSAEDERLRWAWVAVRGILRRVWARGAVVAAAKQSASCSGGAREMVRRAVERRRTGGGAEHGHGEQRRFDLEKGEEVCR